MVIAMRKSILLHFINRDIRENTHCKLLDGDIEKIVFLSLFMSPIIYAELTFEIESKEDIPHTIKYLKKLNDLDIVTAISSANSLEELIVSRRELYKFDEERYPFYFKDDSEIFFPEGILLIDSSTTAFIEDGLRKNYIHQEYLDHCKTHTDLLNYIVTQRLSILDKQALTIRSFDLIFEKLRNKAVDSTIISSTRNIMGRELSRLHNKKYLEATFSSIIKNIPYIHIYDGIDNESIYDYQIYYSILEPIFSDYTRNELEERLIYWKSDDMFNAIINRLYLIVINLQYIFKKEYALLTWQVRSKRIVNYINEKKRNIRQSFGAFLTNEDIYRYLCVFEKQLHISKRMEADMNTLSMEKGISKKILLPVANMNEFRNIINIAEEYGFPLYRQVIGNNTFHIHTSEDFSLYIVKCEAGSLGSASSILTLTDAITNINIDTIIFSGIAFGNYTKRNGDQNIGDILVSKQLWNYESGKVDNNYISRGDKCSATPWLLDRFQNSALKWETSEIHFGVIASGEKLVNSEEFVMKLMNQESELIGGEMEGVGLVSVAERYRKDWILIKGISDWGVGKTDTDQIDVAKKTFRYVFQTIKEYLL